MLELTDISKTYASGDGGTAVLSDVSFTVEEGEYVAIMGASGTGKSTLMNILGCLDRPSGGRYSFDSTAVETLDDKSLSHLRNRRIGFIFQQFHLLERTSALKNVLLPLIYAEHFPEEAEDWAEEALTAVGLADRIDYLPSQLSGGQQQRVAIARSLINNPAVLLADEPTGALDTRSGLEVMAIFESLNRQGRTIIMVTHDREVAEHAKRVIVMRDGRIAEDRKNESPLSAEAELAALDGSPKTSDKEDQE